MTRNLYETLHHPKMHPHTTFGISTANNVGDMHRTRSGTDGRTETKDGQCDYEGCSNMNASSFITFVTCMLRQNGICFFNGLYVTFKLAPDLKKNSVFLLSYSPLNEGHFSILTNSMLLTY